MTPSDIATALTPAQVRALRGRADDRFLCRVHYSTEANLYYAGLFADSGRLTDLGRAVLVELDKDAGDAE